MCGTRKGGKLECHLAGLHTSSRGELNVHVFHVSIDPRCVHCTLSLFLIFVCITTVMTQILFCFIVNNIAFLNLFPSLGSFYLLKFVLCYFFLQNHLLLLNKFVNCFFIFRVLVLSTF